MHLFKSHSKYKDYIYMILGTGLMALAIKSIFDSAGLVTGGFTGIAIIIKNITGNIVKGGVPLWFTNLLLNIPAFFIGYKIKGAHYLKRTFFATIALSIWLFFLPAFPICQGDNFLTVVLGGVLTGIGVGLVLMSRSTTGGTDFVSALIQHYKKHYSIAQILQLIDGAIVFVGIFVFGINKALYALIVIFIVSKVTDGIIEGVKFSKAAFIITEKKEEVSKAIWDKIARGLTSLNATGVYSGNEKNLLICVVSKKEIVELKEIVVNADRKAFVIVSDVREVLGEGFLEM
ncbi:YitT family protein [Anaerosacchariphilus polymeriproducens]|uniref:YitT family protein n=1 Tax=Anaerosacchariphilus polymeriproducens TaxID=1812858 RepID=A0A371AT84_9FIRM|nr:YitT family protein [Anaerosacchariphilus polymeriproducens]RDU22778.1 YitT family protein [Anaerosacchariphilus polymeriproducens]